MSRNISQSQQDEARTDLIRLGFREFARALAAGDAVAVAEGLKELSDSFSMVTSGEPMVAMGSGSVSADPRVTRTVANQTQPARAGRSGLNPAERNGLEPQTHAAKAARSAPRGVEIGQALIAEAIAHIGPGLDRLKVDPTIPSSVCVRAWTKATCERRSPASVGKRLMALYRAGRLPQGMRPDRNGNGYRVWRFPLSLLRQRG